MNFIAINGSPHAQRGNTGLLLDKVVEGVQSAGGTVEMVYLSKIKVNPCVGCDVCHKTGSCPIPDDFEELKKKLLACDGFILASPNYIMSVSAQLKALFDRCCGIIHCQAMDGKYGVVVETSGGGGDEQVIDYMQRVVGMLGAWSVGSVGSSIAGERLFPDQDRLFAKATALGEELYRATLEKREYPDQAGAKLALSAYMRGLVDLMKDFWRYEYDYWTKLGK
ncbi:iron-sulfur cluster-binding flavoprotein [Geotalea daltonii FRC-32]|uniref:Iron-sulfur cluster-binding flavoprotein n=1 Tax=Geotalea daltonii (strain DSM 22248 / JCM 15807 / FRC-32) TaxID=316067 RepID=B9M0E1_GEODF|nr:flavodoxin family protein [Geotalea daltonii]ACM18978.1 iron-sulfur cluster-binding flavoprotein [Geotalea daltonii FRC-32]